MILFSRATRRFYSAEAPVKKTEAPHVTWWQRAARAKNPEAYRLVTDGKKKKPLTKGTQKK